MPSSFSTSDLFPLRQGISTAGVLLTGLSSSQHQTHILRSHVYQDTTLPTVLDTCRTDSTPSLSWVKSCPIGSLFCSGRIFHLHNAASFAIVSHPHCGSPNPRIDTLLVSRTSLRPIPPPLAISVQPLPFLLSSNSALIDIDAARFVIIGFL